MKKLWILLSAALVSFNAGAQALGFLQVGDDPALSGMAGAGVALHSLSPLDNNMAAAALGQEKVLAGASYTLWQPSVGGFGLLNVSATYRVIPQLVVGLSVKDFMSPSYEVTLPNGQVGGTFRPMDLSVGLGAAYQLSEDMSAGVTVRFLSSSLAQEAKGSTVAANLSLKYAAGGLQAGVALNNLGGKISYGGDSYSLPLLLKAGAAYSIAGLTASLEGDYVLGAGMMAGAGLQYGIKDMVFVRAGYHLGQSDKVIPSHVSLGVGLNFSGFRLDVSYLTASKTLGNTLAFGLGYSF